MAAIMATHGVCGLEVAPTKVWPHPTEVDEGAIDSYRCSWLRRGMTFVGMQALLFGKPDLQLFRDEDARQAALNYLSGMIRLGGRLRARALVFGSPKNRTRGEMDFNTATDIAIRFFSTLGDIAEDNGVLLCIEPNPSAYGCDFIRTGAEGVELVQRIDHPAVRLHLDAAIMTMNQEDIDRTLETSVEYLAHFHISEPQLGLIGAGGTEHVRIAGRLRQLGYSNWVSIEMRDGWTSPNTRAISESLEYVTNVYR